MLDRKRAFSIMELMVAVTILTVVASVASVGYTQYRDRAAMLVDETNQKVLLAAVKLYAYDTNALPGSLSQLRPRDVERAYAQVTDGKRPYTLLAFLQEQLGLFDIAEATMSSSLPESYFGNGITQAQRWKLLTCPMDGTPISGSHPSWASYGLHADAAGKPLSWLLDPGNANLSGWQNCIVESDIANPTDNDFAYRHRGGHTFVSASAGGTVETFSL